MMNPSYKGRTLLPMPVIEAARAGDAEAVEQVLRYYEGYINKLCMWRRWYYCPNFERSIISRLTWTWMRWI